MDKDRFIFENVTKKANPALVKLVGESRVKQLSQMVGDGVITPAVSVILTDKFVKTEALTLELSVAPTGNFDFLRDILMQNVPVDQPDVMAREIVRRRVAAGLED